MLERSDLPSGGGKHSLISTVLGAVVAADCVQELQDLADMSPLMEELGEVDEPRLTPLDRNFLGEAEVALQLYADSRIID